MTLEVKLLASVLFNLSITLAEFLGGLLSGSLALLSDSLHNATDTISILFAYFGHKISKKRGNERFTYGYKRAEVVSALTNSVFMVIVSFFLLYEGVKRFFKPETIDLGIMLPVAIGGLLGNLFTIIFLHGERSLNVRAALVHITSDLLSSVLVITAGFIMKTTGVLWPDAVFTLGISLYLMSMGMKLFLESAAILMQAVPKGWSVSRISEALKKLDFVEDVHHVHLWTPDGEKVYAELHVVVKEEVDKLSAFRKIQRVLRDLGVNHATFQIEEKGYHEDLSEMEHEFEEEDLHGHDHE